MACCPCFRQKEKLPRRKVTLLLIGLDNAGKTTAIRGMLGEPQDDITPTIGFTFVDLQLDNFDIKVYDLGGGKNIRGIWKNYYADVHGVIFVIDATAVDRLTECQKTLETVLTQDYVQGKRVLILANKQDQEGALDEIDICDHLDLESMVNRSKCPCRVETCSAIQGTGKKVDKPLREGFRWLLKNISTEWDEVNTRVEQDVAVVNEKEAAARKERLDKVRKAREERLKQEAEERKARGEVEEEPEDGGPIDGDPFKKVNNEYFEDQAQKISSKKEKKKKPKSGPVVIGVNEGTESVKHSGNHSNSDQTFVNEGFEGDTPDEASLRVHENGDSRGSSVDVIDSSGKPEPEGGHSTEESVGAAEKSKKKKKGRKLKKKNKVEQAPLDDREEVPPPTSPRPAVTTPAWAGPQLSLYKPGLDPLPESTSPRTSFLPPITSASQRASALPEIRPTGAKPNSEDDDGVMT